MKQFLFFLLICCSLATFNTQELGRWHKLLPEIETVLEKAKRNIWSEIQPDQPIWNMPPWLGTFFLSEYYFELKALNITGNLNFSSRFNESFFTQKLLKEQGSDGSWMQLVDLNRKQGSLDATIFNYWYLKDVGVDQKSDSMKKARKFILDHGGIEKSQVMTKYKLAAFGQYEWHILHYIPLFIFKNSFPFSYLGSYIKDYIAQWVYPHLTGLAYLRYHKTIFPVSRVCLSELMTSRSSLPCEDKNYHNFHLINKINSSVEGEADVENLLQEGINLKGRRGAFGAYTISTLLNLLSLQDYKIRYNHSSNPKYKDFFDDNLVKSLTFVEDMYFNRRVPYEGSLDDGRYWDTILAAFALLEAGETYEKVSPTVEFLIHNAVQHNGGIPYGHQFQYAPDIDDTAMLLALYGKLYNYFRIHANQTKEHQRLAALYQQQIIRTYSWLKSTQNSDGGFPAFDKDKNDDQYMFIKYIFKFTKIDKSAEIFDPSCADIVGHLLEGMGESNILEVEVIGKMVQFLMKTKRDEMWSARWGINYVYAVGAVYPGLAKVGYNLDQPWIRNVTRRLLELQQEDGGFGEDSQSYNMEKYVKGVTTASMTAWGLLAFLEVTHFQHIDDNIERAAYYLLRNFAQNNGQFFDRSVVGTGHRGVLNLQYPVYAYSFPLVALARLRSYMLGEKKYMMSQEVNKGVEQYLKSDEL